MPRINLGNSLLVSGRTIGIDGSHPDMARAMAERMGVTVRYVPFASPGELADVAGQNIWDVVLIGAEPQRAEKIAFSPAYVEIASTYLVGPESKLRSIGDIDRPGVRIASTARGDLRFVARAQHRACASRWPARSWGRSRISSRWSLMLSPDYAHVCSPMSKVPERAFSRGTSHRTAGHRYRTRQPRGRGLHSRVRGRRQESGLVARLIEKHHVVGLSVAPAA